MASWAEVVAQDPEFAKQVRLRFDAGTNKTLATLRRDGSPRISGTELVFSDRDVSLGMMAGSRKLADVTADPRVAVHSPTLEPPDDAREWLGEAKMSGRLVPSAAPTESSVEDAGYFVLDITEMVLTHIDDTGKLLVVESWHPGRGHQRRTRT
jgi:pyridoxamine 5'-phosphate oxidase-like protein